MSQQNSRSLCQSENVQTYFDDELDPTMHELMKQHISECSVCSAELRALGHLQTLVGLAYGFTSDLTQALQRYSLSSH